MTDESANEPAPELSSAARTAFAGLLNTLEQVGASFASEEWWITSDDDVAETLGVICHHLATGFDLVYTQDPAHPSFRPIVTPWRKSLGDNAYAMYHDSVLDPSNAYVVTGNTGGADYVSFTLEAGAGDGSFPDRTVGVINDESLDIDEEGNFELRLGGAPVPGQERNHLPLDPSASRITVRHYWDTKVTALDNLPNLLGLRITPITETPAADQPAADQPTGTLDAQIAAAIDRMATYVRTRTVDLIARPGTVEPPAFVSQIPNEFPPPVVPGDHALAAADAAYSMAPYLLNRDEALVIRARWPECRCANVNLWNRHMQTYDYANFNVALSRGESVVAEDGSVTVVISEEDPGVPNWLSTRGRQFGLVFWRFMLPVGEIDTPVAEVMPTAEVAGRLG